MNEIVCPQCHSHDEYYETESGVSECTNCRAVIFVGKKQQEPTLRDYFAGQALNNKLTDYGNTYYIARYAYNIADAMIKERNHG
jgi:hypothetical protein